MVELESENEMSRLSNKINVKTKNVKALTLAINTLMERLDKPAETTAEKEKERMDQFFAKKQLGRPRGSFEDKREQYLKMLNEQKIKQPKSQTLEFYKIEKEGDKYVLFN